jgi:predicted O-methyltransferase YrrM
MPLAIVQFAPVADPLPAAARRLCDDAQARIDAFIEARHARPIVAYVPSDFAQVYQAMESIERQMLAPGRRFVEWGSGVGVATCLAAMLDFDAIGIEIEPELVEISRELADDHGLDVEFVHGSFLPEGAEEMVDQQGDVAWLRTDGPDAYAELQLEADDFDVVFAYPWPGEEQLVFDVFEAYAATGALLLTFHGQEGMRLQRRTKK